MADSKADAEVVGDSTETETAKTVPLEQYQGLQRNFDRERKRNTTARIQTGVRLSEFDGRQERVETMLETLLGVLTPSLDEPGQKRLSTLQTNIDEHRKVTKAFAAAKAKAEALAVENDLDLDTDAAFEGYRKAMDERRYDDAVRDVERAITEKGRPPAEDTKALIDAAVAEALKRVGKVDTRTSTATKTRPPALADLLKDPLRGKTPQELKDLKGQLYDALEKETGIRYKR